MSEALPNGMIFELADLARRGKLADWRAIAGLLADFLEDLGGESSLRLSEFLRERKPEEANYWVSPHGFGYNFTVTMTWAEGEKISISAGEADGIKFVDHYEFCYPSLKK